MSIFMVCYPVDRRRRMGCGLRRSKTFAFTKSAWTQSRTPGMEKARPISGTPSKGRPADRKSTRLNSSHSQISYAVFCLKKKKKKKKVYDKFIRVLRWYRDTTRIIVSKQ